MAIAATAVWEVRTTGSDNNGGGYVTGGGGVDYSQQDSAQGNGTNLTVDGTTNTDVTPDGYSPSANDVGNMVHITAGAGFTAGWYEIKSIQGGTKWRLDRSPAATSTSGGTWYMGGALATIAAAAHSTTAAAVAGNTVYVKYHASNTYSIGSAINLSRGSDATTGRQFRIVGYDSTRSEFNRDANRPTLTRSGTNYFFDCAQSHHNQLQNLIMDSNSQNQYCLWCWGFSGSYWRCKIINHSSANAAIVSNNVLHKAIECEIICTSGGIGFCITAIGCICTVSTGTAFYGAFNGSILFLNCIAKGAGTSNGVGFIGNGMMYVNCIAYNLLRGFSVNNTTQGTDQIVNCLAHTCGTGFYDNAAAASYFSNFLLACAYYNCTTGVSTNINASSRFDGSGALTTVISCSADPCTNAASDDFTLNNTSGGGAALRALGYYKIASLSSVGYPDIGAYQHQDSGSGGGLLVQRGLSGGFAQ